MTSTSPATAPNVIALDAPAVLELELDGIKLIEASAGTGKTHTIADLYLRHVLGGRTVAEILVVTFTRASAEELRGRIRERLYQALALTDDPAREAAGFLTLWIENWQSLDDDTRTLQRTRLQLALRSFDESAISTIHGFCQLSLQDHALAGNQRFESEFVDDDKAFWVAASKDWWRKLGDLPERDTWRLVKENLGSLEKMTAELLYLRAKPAARLLPDSDADLAGLLARPRQIAHDLHRLAPVWQARRAELAEALRDSKALSRSKSKKDPYHLSKIDTWLDDIDLFFQSPQAGFLFRDFEFLGAARLEQSSTKTGRGTDPRLEDEFFVAVDRVADDWDAFCQELGPQLRIHALREVSAQVKRDKRQAGILAFQDQLELLLEALQSPSGQRLARQLREQYPVAMIDEFQDTDPVQFRIFEHVYPPGEDISLALIGDPKQAIYSFRGGDIFTYMQARNLPAIEHYNLAVNWRSQPGLVDAVNCLFSMRKDAFIYSGSIDFRPVVPNPDNERYRLQLARGPAPALTLWQLPQDEQGDNYNRDDMRDRINAAIVSEIGALLTAGTDGTASIDGSTIGSGDIAILVRNAREGQAIARLLGEHGIRSVTIGRDSVFACDEASGLYDLLLAVSQCSDPRIARRSLASNLLQLDYLEIAAIVDDDRRWQDWLDRLIELQQLWQRQGFIATFQALLQYFDITQRMARAANSERRITNLLHLSELLQQQSLIEPGQLPLLRWFETQLEDTRENEDAELRLEDDEALVKIVTIHKSKGLQYPIVFVPFLWSCRQVDKDGPLYFHDTDFQACVDLGSAARNSNWLIAEKERLAEDLRLLYVAVTRARSRVYLAWGQAGSARHSGNASQTALAWLLHSRQTPADLDTDAADGFGDGSDLDADLQRLVERGGGAIECRELPELAPAPGRALDTDDGPVPRLARFQRGQPNQWRVNSFTALTRSVHQPPSHGARADTADPILGFPAGSQVGLLLHALLEHLDFERDIASQCTPLFDRLLAQFGISDEHRATLQHWLEQILQTPLDGEGLVLNDIGNARRLNELSFDFALDRLDFEALNRFMQARYPQPLQVLSGAELGGLVTGIIDLVFEYQGRYYLADYKSNFLGAELEDYNPERLQQAMLERRYDLQSLLYMLALHRLLAQRIPNYAYEKHFGGSYYLFLRAMRSQHGPRYGVYFERPPLAEIDAFDTLFDFTPTAVLTA